MIIRVYPVWSEIIGSGVPYKELEKACSYFKQGAQFSQAFKNGRWDGTVKLLKNGRFPTGLLSKVRKVLDAKNISYRLVPMFTWPEKKYDWHLIPEPKDRHIEAINAILDCKRGQLQLPTRFGNIYVVL